jgi:hypothetical protein
MTDGPSQQLENLRRELELRNTPPSVEELSQRLGCLAIGIPQRIPISFFDFRMFRIRRMDRKPERTTDAGAPPSTVEPPIGRLNDRGQRILYLADSPDTAFAESRAGAGEFCLSEWRVNVHKLAMANGGIPPAMLSSRFSKEIYQGTELTAVTTAAHEMILSLFREIYTLDVEDTPDRYRWSIACGMANGFSHKCDRNSAIETAQGTTEWTGRYPFSAIAYPSVRKNRESLNFAFNDSGKAHIRLENVQWVRRSVDGAFTGLDFANAWDGESRLLWKKRPAQFVLKAGEGAKVIKIAETLWSYETADGQTPWFS